MLLGVRLPDVRSETVRAATRYRADLHLAQIDATDRVARDAQRALQQKIRSVGLKRLAGAVGYTSYKLKGARGGDPYGVVFAKGGDESLAGGALESYTQGATIRAQNGQWLAFPTQALPKKIGRYKITPDRYNKSSLTSSIGKLEFRPLGPGRAALVVKKVTLSAKTGRAKRAGKRAPRTRIAAKEIIAFILIRVTTRAKRFDKDVVAFSINQKVPDYIVSALNRVSDIRANF